MSDQPIAAPVAEAQNTATVITNHEEPAVVKPEATTDAPESAEAKPEKTAEQKELEYLRRKATKADRNNARLHQENQQLRERAPSNDEGREAQPGVDPVALADHIATAREIAKQSNGVAADGQKRFGATWASALGAVIEEAGPLIDAKTMLATPLGEAILDAKDPAALLHHLGSDPSLAEELSELSPARLGRRIAQIELQMGVKPAKPVSNAPAPIKPINGAAGSNVFDPETADFAAYERERKKRNPRWG